MSSRERAEAIMLHVRAAGGDTGKMRGGLESLITAEIQAARQEERVRCAQEALNAKLPDNYQWGRDAMTSFNYGKERAAAAIWNLGNTE